MDSLSLRAKFDHLVVGVRSLAEGVREFEQLTGVKPVAGGRHPDRGTENALVSLGDGRYLEIIAPQQGAPLAPADEALREMDTLRIIDWAVSVSDIEAARAALESVGFDPAATRPGSRVTPSGERLEWTTFGLADREIAVAPFFIAWSASTTHPSRTAPGGCALSAMAVRDRAIDRLAPALDALGVTGLTYVHGSARIEATITCRARAVVLRTS